MILHKAQAEIAKDTHRFRVVDCGRRFGKTSLSIEEIKGKVIFKPRRIAYIAPTYQQARDIAWQALRKELKPISKTINESRLEITTHAQGGDESFIQLRGWENVETLRGQQFDFLVIDEVASMRNFWLNWQEIIRPTLTDTRGEVLFIGTPKGFNHFYDLYNKEKEDKDYKSFSFTTYDNPHISKEEIDKARQELTEDRFAQEYLADFRKTEGLVYKEFDRNTHIFDDYNKPETFVDRFLGVDFGWNNPSCILHIGVDSDGRFWVLEEWYKSQKTTSQIIERCKGFEANFVYPDPAEPDRIAEMEMAGLNIREVNKNKGSVVAGINRIKELFKQGRIMVHRDCPNTISELETYHYKEWKNQEANEPEEPEKKDDHAVDALRYSIYTYEPPITKEEEFEFNLYKETYS